MDKCKPKFKNGDKVNVKCSRYNDFPLSYIYRATIVNVKYCADMVNRCWQYRVQYEDGTISYRWFLEDLIKFPNEQYDVEVLE